MFYKMVTRVFKTRRCLLVLNFLKIPQGMAFLFSCIKTSKVTKWQVNMRCRDVLAQKHSRLSKPPMASKSKVLSFYYSFILHDTNSNKVANWFYFIFPFHRISSKDKEEQEVLYAKDAWALSNNKSHLFVQNVVTIIYRHDLKSSDILLNYRF